MSRLYLSSEIAILHLAKCPIEIIIAQTITAHILFYFFVCGKSAGLHSIQIHQERNIIFDFVLYDNYQKSTNWSFFIWFCCEIAQNESHRYCNELAIVRFGQVFFFPSEFLFASNVMSNNFRSGFIFISSLCETVCKAWIVDSWKIEKKKTNWNKGNGANNDFPMQTEQVWRQMLMFLFNSQIKLALTRHILFAHLLRHNIKWCTFRMQ